MLEQLMVYISMEEVQAVWMRNTGPTVFFLQLVVDNCGYNPENVYLQD